QDFSVSTASPSLEQIENYIFASYSDFFMKHDALQPAYSEYRQLKFSNEPIKIELWKNQTKPMSNQEIQVVVKQKKETCIGMDNPVFAHHPFIIFVCFASSKACIIYSMYLYLFNLFRIYIQSK